MNCHNCGAAMELFDRRRYYFCRHCGSFHFIETEALDGVRVLARDAAALPCPLCAEHLASAQLDDTFVVKHCERCRGVLMARSTFADVVTLRRARASGEGVIPAPLDRRELQRHLTCPACGARMDVHPYGGPGNIVIDSCSRCDLLWLDHGELKQVGDAPGGDRGARRHLAASGPSPAPPPAAAPRIGAPPMSVLDLLDTLLR
jgi:Zn-finger nucleic acid-binding protein/DNA-directed RNA polymerase subunit RPC12/RpoP